MRIDLPQCNLDSCHWNCDHNCTKENMYERCNYTHAKQHLAAYEDTGLTPEEVQELAGAKKEEG